MKKQYTANDLWAFVWRADSHNKIEIAAKWLIDNVDDIDLFDDLMIYLSQKNRELSAEESGREHHI